MEVGVRIYPKDKQVRRPPGLVPWTQSKKHTGLLWSDQVLEKAMAEITKLLEASTGLQELRSVHKKCFKELARDIPTPEKEKVKPPSPAPPSLQTI